MRSSSVKNFSFDNKSMKNNGCIMGVFRGCQVSGTLALFVLEARGKGFLFPMSADSIPDKSTPDRRLFYFPLLIPNPFLQKVQLRRAKILLGNIIIPRKWSTGHVITLSAWAGGSKSFTLPTPDLRVGPQVPRAAIDAESSQSSLCNAHGGSMV